MAILSAAKRKKLPTQDFAVPSQRAYPVNDPNHARAALEMVSKYGTGEEKQQVKAKVKKKFPGIK